MVVWRCLASIPGEDCAQSHSTTRVPSVLCAIDTSQVPQGPGSAPKAWLLRRTGTQLIARRQTTKSPIAGAYGHDLSVAITDSQIALFNAASSSYRSAGMRASTSFAAHMRCDGFGESRPSHASDVGVQYLKSPQLGRVQTRRVNWSPRHSKRWKHGADKPSKHCARITKTESNS